MAHVLIFMVFATIAGMQFYRWVNSERRKTHRRLSETPRTMVGQLQGGTVRIVGTVRAVGEELQAPLSGRPCVAYEVRVEIYDGESWLERVRRRGAVEFALVDETGEARVRPGENYQLLLADDAQGETDGDEEPPYPAPLAAAIALLENEGVETKTFWLRRLIRLRFIEAILKEGERVAAYGAAIEMIDPEGERTGPRAMPILRILRGTAEEPVRIGDGPMAADEVPRLLL